MDGSACRLLCVNLLGVQQTAAPLPVCEMGTLEGCADRVRNLVPGPQGSQIPLRSLLMTRTLHGIAAGRPVGTRRERSMTRACPERVRCNYCFGSGDVQPQKRWSISDSSCPADSGLLFSGPPAMACHCWGLRRFSRGTPSAPVPATHGTFRTRTGWGEDFSSPAGFCWCVSSLRAGALP